MRMLAVGMILLISTACTTTRTSWDVDLALDAVQRPEDVAQRWGDYQLAQADSSGFTYEDDLISLAVVPLSGTFSAVIGNQTEHSIRLLWGEASYVGPTGLSSGVVPGETRWIDMGNAPQNQVIPTGARAAITVIPKANANTSEMTISPFFPTTASCDAVVGTTMRLLLPFEIEGVTNEYSLQFTTREASKITWEVNTMDGTSTEAGRLKCRE